MNNANDKPIEILIMFCGMFVFFFVHFLIPESDKLLRVIGFLSSTAILITSLILMIKKRKKIKGLVEGSLTEIYK
jgi:hypothetical protein